MVGLALGVLLGCGARAMVDSAAEEEEDDVGSEGGQGGAAGGSAPEFVGTGARGSGSRGC